MEIFRVIQKDSIFNERIEKGFFKNIDKAREHIEFLKQCDKGYTPCKYTIETIKVK